MSGNIILVNNLLYDFPPEMLHHFIRFFGDFDKLSKIYDKRMS